VAVVVPARDEADMLPRTLPALLAQDYPGAVHVVVVDDRSTDGTGDVARELAGTRAGRYRRGAHAGPEDAERWHQGLRRVTVVKGTALPNGWVGKPWAMAQGVAAAMAVQPQPRWALFTDADIAHPEGSLTALVQTAVSDDRDLVSVMARLSAQGSWESLLMPAFVYFFAQIYPFSWVNDRARRTAAAAGGCLLVNMKALHAAGGVEAIKGDVIDDVALARSLRRAGKDLWLTLAGEGAPGQAPAVLSLRRYPRLADVWAMVSRTAYTQLRHSPAALAGAVAGLSAMYVAPLVLTVAGLARRRPSWALPGLVSWTLMTRTYLPMANYYGVPPLTAPALPLTAGLYMAMTLSSAARHTRRTAARPARAKLDRWR
jgi:hopene-associated glycosyltransferase HpnB